MDSIELNSVWSKTHTVYVEMIPSKSVQKNPGQIWKKIEENH